MDPAPLVTAVIDAGAQFVERFDRYAPVRAAFWMRAADEPKPYLYIASDRFTDANIDVGYGEVLRLDREMRNPNFDPFRVRLVGPSDPAVQAVLDIYRRYPGRIPTWYNGPTLGGLPVDEVYIYPEPPTAVAKGA